MRIRVEEGRTGPLGVRGRFVCDAELKQGGAQSSHRPRRAHPDQRPAACRQRSVPPSHDAAKKVGRSRRCCVVGRSDPGRTCRPMTDGHQTSCRMRFCDCCQLSSHLLRSPTRGRQCCQVSDDDVHRWRQRARQEQLMQIGAAASAPRWRRDTSPSPPCRSSLPQAPAGTPMERREEWTGNHGGSITGGGRGYRR